MLGLDGEALLGYLRAYRHRMANHVQVAAGWLELGDLPKARQALEALTRRLAAEARLTAALPAPLAGLILGLVLQAEAQGIEVDLAADEMESGLASPRAAAPALTPAAAPSPTPSASEAACDAVARGWARLQAALEGPKLRPGGRRMRVRWAGNRVMLDAPASGLPAVVVSLDERAVYGPGE